MKHSHPRNIVHVIELSAARSQGDRGFSCPAILKRAVLVNVAFLVVEAAVEALSPTSLQTVTQ